MTKIPNKIFQIGFNKCGTSSLYNLFSVYSKPNIPSIHWDNGNLAYNIHRRLLNQEPVLLDYKDIVFFSDMEFIHYDYDDNKKSKIIEAYKYYKIFDIQYPSSKFILNIRDIDKWLMSRLKHVCYFSSIQNKTIISHVEDKHTYLLYYKKIYNTDIVQEVVDAWKAEYNEHINNVMQYFADRPEDLLVYNIETDDFSKISNFFNKYDINFSTNKLPMINKSE